MAQIPIMSELNEVDVSKQKLDAIAYDLRNIHTYATNLSAELQYIMANIFKDRINIIVSGFNTLDFTKVALDDTDCLICQNVITKNEKCGILPCCDRALHVHCYIMHLVSIPVEGTNIKCPNCRMLLVEYDFPVIRSTSTLETILNTTTHALKTIDSTTPSDTRIVSMSHNMYSNILMILHNMIKNYNVVGANDANDADPVNEDINITPP
jgi:hypothetical protein